MFDWRKVLHPDDLPRILQEQIAGESSLKPFVLEARYKRADGEWRWLRSESQPRWDPTGQHIGFIGVAHDITAAKQAEIELRRMNEMLEQRIASAPRSSNPTKRRCARSSRPATSIRDCSIENGKRALCQRDGAGRHPRRCHRRHRQAVLGNALVYRHRRHERRRSQRLRGGHAAAKKCRPRCCCSCRSASAISISPCGRCSTSTAP